MRFSAIRFTVYLNMCAGLLIILSLAKGKNNLPTAGFWRNCAVRVNYFISQDKFTIVNTIYYVGNVIT